MYSSDSMAFFLDLKSELELWVCYATLKDLKSGLELWVFYATLKGF